jgi:hypothetical protein
MRRGNDEDADGFAQDAVGCAAAQCSVFVDADDGMLVVTPSSRPSPSWKHPGMHAR